MDTIKIPPYGQHFNCAERMLGKSRYRVFSRLMDECSTIIAREQMNRYFTISVSSLSYRAGGMDRTLVNSVLEWLKKRSIISISSAGEIMVNIGLYISLIDKFNSIDKKMSLDLFKIWKIAKICQTCMASKKSPLQKQLRFL